MTTDRELLEAVAKAAGIKGYYSERWEGIKCPVPDALNEGDYTFWDPLTSDSDALQLAVKLRLNVQFTRGLGRSHTEEFMQVCPARFGHLAEFGPLGDDPGATIRRAIVRAAAALSADQPIGDQPKT